MNKKKINSRRVNLTSLAFSVLYLGANLLGKSTRPITLVRNAVYLTKDFKRFR